MRIGENIILSECDVIRHPKLPLSSIPVYSAKLNPSLVPKPVYVIRVSRGGLEPKRRTFPT